MSSWSSAAASRRRGRRLGWAGRVPAAVQVALACGLAVLASGCVRFRADLTVAPDQTVSGTIVVAVQTVVSTGLPTLGELPTPLREHVGSEVYNQDGYVGSKLTLRRLPFDQFDDLIRRAGATATANLPNLAGLTDLPGLPGVPSPSSGSEASPGASPPTGSTTTDLSLRLDGNKVLVSGSFFFPTLGFGADAATADVRLAMTFAGDVVSANGVRDGRRVTWTFTLGQVQPVQAAAYLRGSPGAGVGRLGLLGAGGLLMALVAAVAVLLTRRRMLATSAGGPRPGAEVPAREVRPAEPMPAGADRAVASGVPAAFVGDPVTEQATGAETGRPAGPPAARPLRRDRPAAAPETGRRPSRPVHPLHQDAPAAHASGYGQPETDPQPVRVPSRPVHPLHQDGPADQDRLGRTHPRAAARQGDRAVAAGGRQGGVVPEFPTELARRGSGGAGESRPATSPAYPFAPGRPANDPGRPGTDRPVSPGASPPPPAGDRRGDAGPDATDPPGPPFAPWLDPVASLAHRVAAAAGKARGGRHRGGRHRRQESSPPALTGSATPTHEAQPPARLPSVGPSRPTAPRPEAQPPARPPSVGPTRPTAPPPAPPYPYPITARPAPPAPPTPAPEQTAAPPGRTEVRGSHGTPVPPGPGLSPPDTVPWAPPDPR